ncbi:MAG: hypothetical protein KF781_03715 [Chitinophagaceae bacterium]|nr:hypothetical protein [Chitinophagaceae bacterium]MCW5904809.1 hypothetical protein [Chitinophagaceae bacterium]
MKNDILFFIAIILALWFTVTGIFWVYWFAVIFAYPAGIASFFIWQTIKKDNKKRNKLIPFMLTIGLIASLAFLAYILIGNN